MGEEDQAPIVLQFVMQMIKKSQQHMLSQTKWLNKIEEVEQDYQFADGFKSLYCTWRTIKVYNIALISLNIGRS